MQLLYANSLFKAMIGIHGKSDLESQRSGRDGEKADHKSIIYLLGRHSKCTTVKTAHSLSVVTEKRRKILRENVLSCQGDSEL